MRVKKPHAVVTFASTADAMAVQAAADAGSVAGRMIPVPSEISAGCGLAWCAPDDDAEGIAAALVAACLAFAAVDIVNLY